MNKNSLPDCCINEKIFFNEALTNLNHKTLIFNFLTDYFVFKDFIVVRKNENLLIKYFHKTYFCNEKMNMCEGMKVGFKKTDMIVRNKENINEYFLGLICDFVKEMSTGVFVDGYEIAVLYDLSVFSTNDTLLALPCGKK